MTNLLIQETQIAIDIAKLIRLNPNASSEWFVAEFRKIIGNSEFDINARYKDRIIISTKSEYQDKGKRYKEYKDTYQLEGIEFEDGINGPLTLLAFAASQDHTQAVKALFEMGAKSSVSFGYRQAWSDFQWAIRFKNFEMLDIFRENGADMSDFDGISFIDYVEYSTACFYNWSPIGNAMYENCMDKAIMHGISPFPHNDSRVCAESWGYSINELFKKIESGDLDITGSVLHRDFVLLAEKAGIKIDRSKVTLSGDANGQNVIEHFYQIYIHNKEGNYSNKATGTYTLSYKAFKEALAKDKQEESEYTKRLEETEKYAQIAYKDALKASEFREKQEEERALAEKEAAEELATNLASSIIKEALADIQASAANTSTNVDLATNEASKEQSQVKVAGDSGSGHCIIL